MEQITVLRGYELNRLVDRYDIVGLARKSFTQIPEEVKNSVEDFWLEIKGENVTLVWRGKRLYEVYRAGEVRMGVSGNSVSYFDLPQEVKEELRSFVAKYDYK